MMESLVVAQPDLSGAPGAFSSADGTTGADGLARPRQADQSSAILKLKGLPYSATEDDIRQFFAPYELKGISFVYEPDGRPSGLAFAEFANKEEALKALSKNGEYIGQRYVRLLHVPRAEMEEQVRLGTLAIPGAAAKLRSRMIRSQQRNVGFMAGAPVQLMSGMMPGSRPLVAVGPPGHGPNAGMGAPFAQHGVGQATMESRLWQPAYGQQQGQQGSLPQGGAQGAGGMPLQQHHAQYGAPSPAQLAAQFSSLGIGQQGAMHGGASGAGSMPRGGQMGGGGLMPHAGLAGAGTPMLAGQPAAQLHMAAAPQQAQGPAGQFLTGPRVVQAATSPTIKIRGLPYRSSPSEILAFFQSYHFLPDTLQIGLDQLGRPSGEAWLSFANPQEALRAVRDLNRHYLGNRYLELSMC